MAKIYAAARQGQRGGAGGERDWLRCEMGAWSPSCEGRRVNVKLSV